MSVSVFLLPPIFVNVSRFLPFCFEDIMNKGAHFLLNYIAWCEGFFGRRSVLIWGRLIIPMFGTVLVLLGGAGCWGG